MDSATNQQPRAPSVEYVPALPPLGATVGDGAVVFRVWAPAARRVEVELYLPAGVRHVPMEPDGSAEGMVAVRIADISPGTLYKYRLDGEVSYSDPCSRFQPEGVHGPSAVVDPRAFAWSDGGWPGLSREKLVIYELHIGTFTTEGTFHSAIERLDALRELGVGAIELLPVADFPGNRNWGYDGVALYAPARAYGGPDGLRRLVDAAHARGLGVLLDVVYNHLGPDGNYLRAFSPHYFTDRYSTPWGDAIDYDGRHARPVREYVLQNAEHWLREYHVDGFRLDATHAIYDRSEPHILAELATRARAATPRAIVIVAENDANDVRLVTPQADGGFGLDALWADDFHHAVHMTLTGEREGYYEDYAGGAAEIAKAVRDGFLYQGQHSRHLGRGRGTPVRGEPASAFVFCLQNHDQVGNRALGERLSQLVHPDCYLAATALLLFAPETPLLFMGQEFAASTPFLYFTDHNPDLGRLVTEGRRSEFGGFNAFHDPQLRERIPDPQAKETFLRSKLDWNEAERHAGVPRLYRELLALRHDDPVLSHNDRAAAEAEALGERLVAVLRRHAGEVRLLLANLGDEAVRLDAEAAILAPLQGRALRLLLATDDARYRAAEGDASKASSALPGEIGEIVVPARTAWVLGTE
jgi:maltooligosyltrehalose trehalohydrolase